MTKAIISSILLVFALAIVARSQTPVKAMHRVVFQMTEPEGAAWDELTVRVNNLLANLLSDGAEVEIVFFGKGLNMLRKTNVAYEKRFQQFARYGVVFAACQNSMDAMNLTS